MFTQNTYCWLVTKSFTNTWKEINFIGKLQGASVFMFLFSQVFLKNIGLRCRTFIIKNRTFAAHLLVAACDVLDLSVLFAYWDGYTFSKRSFFKDAYFANYSCLLFFFCLLLFGLIILIMWKCHDIHATLLWMFLDRTTFWPLWLIICSLIFLDVDIP